MMKEWSEHGTANDQLKCNMLFAAITYFEDALEEGEFKGTDPSDMARMLEVLRMHVRKKTKEWTGHDSTQI